MKLFATILALEGYVGLAEDASAAYERLRERLGAPCEVEVRERGRRRSRESPGSAVIFSTTGCCEAELEVSMSCTGVCAPGPPARLQQVETSLVINRAE